MRTGWMALGLLALSTAALADEGRAAVGRYEALPLAGADGGKGGARAFILDTRDGHVWIWSENELITAPDGRRRYGAGFIYQGKLRPGSQPGEMIEQQGR
ncbi:hypothetical protein ABW22_14545 [Thiobacillus denitrificans]|uniref:Uncharacterized protein n=2 Tax=Thiobacillus denitrificans TaxID=36861 RepID=A0A106BJ46_THIDE|nr:hypothetical protein ABW22_14545 [Thiobacillus denitrificans]